MRRDIDNRLKAGRTLAVGGVDGSLFGVTCIEGRLAGDGCAAGGLEDGANTDVVNDRRVDLCAVFDRD